jgi:GDP/UDP-N,N'-diacetylbacillosamine 2-epimerase (hydrolysing)
MGESPRTIVVTGAPGLDGIEQLARFDRATLCADLQLDPARPLSLLAYHPVTQTSASAGRETEQILDALRARQIQVLALMPNSDAGNDVVRAALRRGAEHADLRLATHLSRERFVSWMAVIDLMIGNSSAGIIEAASFGTPVINVGSRQNLRERNGNVVDVEPDSGALTRAIDAVLRHGRYQPRNIYGDGRAGERIVEFLRSVQPDASVMMKSNGY